MCVCAGVRECVNMYVYVHVLPGSIQDYKMSDAVGKIWVNSLYIVKVSCVFFIHLEW